MKHSTLENGGWGDGSQSDDSFVGKITMSNYDLLEKLIEKTNERSDYKIFLEKGSSMTIKNASFIAISSNNFSFRNDYDNNLKDGLENACYYLISVVFMNGIQFNVNKYSK